MADVRDQAMRVMAGQLFKMIAQDVDSQSEPGFKRFAEIMQMQPGSAAIKDRKDGSFEFTFAIKDGTRRKWILS